MAAAGYKVTDAATRRKIFTVCTFCNSSTNGFEKKLFTTPQPKGPFFPILAEMETGVNGDPDELGRTIVCVACFHHLLRQWSSYERRCIPLAKRCYKLITGMLIAIHSRATAAHLTFDTGLHLILTSTQKSFVEVYIIISLTSLV